MQDDALFADWGASFNGVGSSVAASLWKSPDPVPPFGAEQNRSDRS